MNIRYLIPRLARHFMPEFIARQLLRRNWLLEPGLETRDPGAAADRYMSVLEEIGCSLAGKRVLVFGYGGHFALGAHLLRRGAAHVALCDHIPSIDHQRNRLLLQEFPEYFKSAEDAVSPRPDFFTLVHGDIRDPQLTGAIGRVDFVLSYSVYEHLVDVEGITRALAVLTAPDGQQVHFVDLRDHYLKYPFEMLKFSKRIWYGWLNPSSNHNRYRLWDYHRVFEAAFGRTDIRVLARDEAAFQKALQAIRPEFLSGNPADDSVTLILVLASNPLARK